MLIIILYVLIIILYVLILILYVDHKCLLHQKIYIDKNGNTTYIKSYFCNNAYLIVNYKSKCTYLLSIQFPCVQFPCIQFPQIQFPLALCSINKSSKREDSSVL